jgi:hypothetical protein
VVHGEDFVGRVIEGVDVGQPPENDGMEFPAGGGVSVYGLGRLSVTLYYELRIWLLDVSGDLRNILEDNRSKLKLKVYA